MSKVKEFFVKFFENLGCEVESPEENALIVRNVPVNFEKFSGKKSPYFFSFGFEKEGYDSVNQNYYLLKSMKEFLEGRGKTTLLKIESSFDVLEELPKLILLRNSEIKNFSKQISNDFLFRFSFASVFQYLNEREQVINDIYVRDGKVVDFDNSFVLLEGSKREVGEIDFSSDYEFAKSRLKDLIKDKTNFFGNKLSALLKSEISRINSHYVSQIEEVEKQRENLLKQLSSSSGEKRAKFEKMLENFDRDNSVDKIMEEENLQIKQETKKHSLSIKNSLLNVSIIYYPVYKISLVLKHPGGNKVLNLGYDSFEDKVSDMFCDSCGGKLDEIIVCSAGHLTCRNCGDKCESCEGIFCKSCSDKICSFCDRNICSACESICDKCMKVFCKNHTQAVGKTGKRICRDCVERCFSCREVIEPRTGREISGKLFCVKCFARENGKKVLEGVFE